MRATVQIDTDCCRLQQNMVTELKVCRGNDETNSIFHFSPTLKRFFPSTGRSEKNSINQSEAVSFAGDIIKNPESTHKNILHVK